MISFMLPTFVAALLTDIRTQLTDVLSILAALGHKGDGQATNLCALYIQANAFRHVAKSGFLKAGSSAIIAIDRTYIAGFNALFKILYAHSKPLLLNIRP